MPSGGAVARRGGGLPGDSRAVRSDGKPAASGAAQFVPFAALRGLQGLIDEQAAMASVETTSCAETDEGRQVYLDDETLAAQLASPQVPPGPVLPGISGRAGGSRGGEAGRRRFVRVRCEIDEKGEIVPLAVIWTPGVAYEVTKVVRSESWHCMGTGRGRRFTIWFGGHMTHLYWDAQRWFVFEKGG